MEISFIVEQFVHATKSLSLTWNQCRENDQWEGATSRMCDCLLLRKVASKTYRTIAVDGRHVERYKAKDLTVKWRSWTKLVVR